MQMIDVRERRAEVLGELPIHLDCAGVEDDLVFALVGKWLFLDDVNGDIRIVERGSADQRLWIFLLAQRFGHGQQDRKEKQPGGQESLLPHRNNAKPRLMRTRL